MGMQKMPGRNQDGVVTHTPGENARTLKKKARYYYDLGFNVLPVKIVVEDRKEKKKPNVRKWKRWQTLRMTEEEFENLPWGESEYFGVICGYNGFVSIDADNLNEDQYKIVDTILNQPVTEKIRTKRGFHWNFQSANVKKGEKKTQEKSSLEYLGAGNFVIVEGLDNRYQRVNDNLPRQTPDAHALYQHVLEVLDWVKKQALKQPKDLKEIRPCITAALNGASLEGSAGDKMRLCCAVEYLQAGYDVDQVVEVFRSAPAIQVDFKEKTTRKKVKYAKKQGYETWKCKTIRELGFCIGTKDCEWIKKFATEKKKQKSKQETEETEEREERYLPSIELSDGRLAEEAFDGKQIYYLVYDQKTGKVKKSTEITLKTLVLKPIDNAEVRTGTVLLPSDVEEYGNEEELMEEIRDFLNRWHEAPTILSRTLDSLYCFLSYIYDLIPQLPYRRYLAPWGKGKSAWLETLGWICYRGILLAGSDTDKSVVRKLNNWRGTALIDEADFGDSSFYAFIIKILNIGYDRKTGFYHRSDDNDPTKTLSYTVFGPKLLATRQKYKDLALESRCLTTVGRQNVKPVPLFRMNKFLEEAQHLRNKLTLWRFRNYYKIKEEAATLEDKNIASKVYDGADNISSRVKQVILPLWLIAGDSMKETLTDLAKTIDARLKIEDPDYLLELQAKDAVKAIMEEYEEEADKDEKSVNIRNLVNILSEAPQGILYEIQLSLISRTILKGRGAKEDDITVSDVTSTSKMLKSVFETNLGFSIHIGKKRRRVVVIPSSWIKKEDKPLGGLDDFV